MKQFEKGLRLTKNRAEKEKMFLKKYAKLGTELKGRDRYGQNALQMFSCTFDFHLTNFSNEEKTSIAEILLKKSADFNIDINEANSGNFNAFHTACFENNIKLVEVIIDLAESMNFNLKAKTSLGLTGFEIAENLGHQNIVNMIQRKLPVGEY